MTRSDFDEWRSPNRILEVAIQKVCYPITESVLLQIFGSFGVVEQVQVFGGTDVVLARVVFESKDVAADAFGELHGRNIYDGCCQLDIKWGLYQECEATPATNSGTMESSHAQIVPELHSSPSPAAFSASETSSSSSPTPIPTSVAQGAEERTPTASPTRCLSECLCHDIDLLKPISAATISTLALADSDVADDSDVAVVMSNGYTAAGLSSLSSHSASVAISTFDDDISSVMLPVEATASGTHTTATTIAAPNDSVDIVVQPDIVLDVMYHGTTDELQVPAILVTKNILALDCVVAALAIDTVANNVTDGAFITCSTAYLSTNIHVLAPMCIVEATPTLVLLAAPTMSIVMSSSTFLVHANLSEHEFEEMLSGSNTLFNSVTGLEMLVKPHCKYLFSGCNISSFNLQRGCVPLDMHEHSTVIMWPLLRKLVEQQPWPPPAELEFASDDAEIRPSPWPSFYLAEGFIVEVVFSLLIKPSCPLPTQKYFRLVPAETVQSLVCMMLSLGLLKCLDDKNFIPQLKIMQDVAASIIVEPWNIFLGGTTSSYKDISEMLDICELLEINYLLNSQLEFRFLHHEDENLQAHMAAISVRKSTGLPPACRGFGGVPTEMVESKLRISNSEGCQPWDPGITVKVFTCCLLSQDNFLKSNISCHLKGPLEMLPTWESWVRSNFFQAPSRWCISFCTLSFMADRRHCTSKGSVMQLEPAWSENLNYGVLRFSSGVPNSATCAFASMVGKHKLVCELDCILSRIGCDMMQSTISIFRVVCSGSVNHGCKWKYKLLLLTHGELHQLKCGGFGDNIYARSIITFSGVLAFSTKFRILSTIVKCELKLPSVVGIHLMGYCTFLVWIIHLLMTWDLGGVVLDLLIRLPSAWGQAEA